MFNNFSRCRFLINNTSFKSFMVVVSIACTCYLFSCSSMPTGQIRYIDQQTGAELKDPARTAQKQIQQRPYMLGVIPAPWTTWKNEPTKYKRIFDDIKAPVKLINTISLWAAIICGVASISIQTPGISTVLRRGAYASGAAYGITVALLFIFGFFIEFWWILLIIVLITLSFILKEFGFDVGKIWQRLTKNIKGLGDDAA